MDYRLARYIIALLIIVGITATACKNDKAPTVDDTPKTRLQTPQFVADNAYANIEQQLAFGYRVPGTDGHKAMQDWAIAEFKSLGAKVIEQEFKANFLSEKNVPCKNIIAQFFPEKSKRVLLGAHYDSRMIAEKDDERQDQPIPGADDGGSGVGVLMEVARAISENPLGIGVDIILFDAEDQGDTTLNSSDTWALGSNWIWSVRKALPSVKKSTLRRGHHSYKTRSGP